MNKYLLLLPLIILTLSLSAEPNFYPFTNIAEHFASLGCPTCLDALAGVNSVHDQLHNGEFVSARHYIQSGDLSYPGVDDRFAYYNIFSTPVMIFNGKVKVFGGGDNVINGTAYINALKATRYWGSPLKVEIANFNASSGALSGTVHNLSPALDLSNADIVFLLAENNLGTNISRAIRAFAVNDFAISGQGTTVNFNHNFTLDPTWTAANLWAAVFIQSESQTILQTATTLPLPDLHVRAAFDWDPGIILPVGFHYESQPIHFFNLGLAQTFIFQIVVDSAPANWYFNYCDEDGACFPGSIPRPVTLANGQNTSFHLNILVGDSGVANFYWLITAPGMQDYKVYFTIATDDVSTPGDSGMISPPVIRAVSPNPFSGSTRISFDLPKGDRIKVEIFNVRGQHIATLTDGRYAAGNHEMIWDGKDKTGKTAPTGVYFCRLTTPGTSVTRKILRL